MSAEPTLDVMTKLRLGAFAAEMAAKHPDQARTIMTLQDTLEQRLPLDLQNKIIEKLNKDPKGTLAAAGALIDKDPKILDAVNRDPSKLATIMGIQSPAAPAVAQTAQAATPPAAAANAPAGAEPPKPAAVAATVAAAAPKPVSDQDIAMRTKLSQESAAITKMPGFEEFAAKAEKSQSLTQAMNAMMGKGSQTPEETLKALQDIKKDPEFFTKANKAIDEIPPQMRENVFSSIAENPALGRAAITGDQNAKMQLMMGGMFGGGAGGGLSNLFGPNSPLQGITQMLGNLLPKLMQGLMETFKPMIDSIKKFAGANGLMGGMGNGGGELLKQYSRTVDNALGTTSGQTPVVDARDPQGSPARPVAEYNGPYEPTGKLTVIPKPEQDPKLAQTGQQPALGTN